MAHDNSVVIVMRTYQRPIMLARAITSVCKQTYKNWSLIIVNNGGEPGGVEDVVAVARTGWPNAQIEIIHLDNRVGMEEASNVALQHTHADFFAIHDDDDSWRPQFLEKTVAAMQAHPDAVAIVTGVTRIHELARGKTLRPQKSELFYISPDRLTFDGMIGHNTFPPIAALFRYSLLAQVGMFDASLPVLGDWEFNLRALTVGRFDFFPERLANYHTRTLDSDREDDHPKSDDHDRHRVTKELLIDRWRSDVTPDGRNKGEVAQAAHVEFVRRESEEASRQHVPAQPFVVRHIRRVLYGVKHPRVGARAVVRRIRRKVGR